LHNTVTLAKDGIQPVLPEDLIYRFAMKLDFKTATNKVAEDAVRMVQRMSLDWMVMGRRPSGVCGACLILAARMNNFRRTVTEVVYIVKVTTHTIQKRLDEFKRTPSSALTVEEFLNNEFLESAHDPPSFYEKQEEFIKNKKTRKRKRKGESADENNEGAEGEGDDANKRRKTALTPGEIRRDADGFAIPPPPTPQSQPNKDIPIDPNLVDAAIEDQSGTSFEQLVSQFGDALDAPASEDEDDEDDENISKDSGGRPIYVPEEWAADERNLEDQISEMISDPHTQSHAIAYARACKRANKYMNFLRQTYPQKEISMDVHIGEDEFADDPEVMNCMLSPADVAAKERVWVNENKSWLRKQQLKEYQKRMAADGPPKATRNRKKKPRIGEGQTSAANSPAEAAISVLKSRTWSKKINYDVIGGMFDDLGYPGSSLGSATTSRRTSVAGSTVASSVAGSPTADDEDEDEESGPNTAAEKAKTAAPAPVQREREPSVAPSVASAAETEDETADWRAGFKKPRPEDGEEMFDDYDEEEYDDPGMGDVEDMDGTMGDFDDDD
jgi:transcription factor IIIB subunit 2